VKATRPLLVAAVAALTLSACAPTGDVAIEVGKTRYTSSDIDLLTTFQCTIAGDPAAGVTSLSRQSARAFMATVLVSSALDQRIADRAGVKPNESELASTMSQLQPYIEKAAKGDDRKRLTELVEQSILGQFAVGTVVQQTLGDQLGSIDQQQAQQMVQAGIEALRKDEAAKADTEIDPSLGLSADGLTAAGSDPSLSKAVSSFAKASTEAQPDQAWLDALPARQQCG
jgi:hypothetical protein